MPFVLIAGEEDGAAGAVSFRYRDGQQKNGVPVEDAVAEIVAAVAEPGPGVSERAAPAGGADEARLRVFPSSPASSPRPTTGSSGCGRRTGWPTSGASGQAAEDRRGLPVLPGTRSAPTTEGLSSHRGEHCYVVMNLFPYNPGHVLVCPYRHVSLYIDLTDEETVEFTALTKQAMRR